MQYKDIVIRLEKLHLIRRIIRQKATIDFPMHPGQLHLLEFINRNGGCTQAEVAENLMISPASVAVSTKRMEKAGLVEKRTAEGNLRCKRLYITDKGKRLSERCREAFDEFDRIVFTGFTKDELKTLRSYLDRLLDNINREYFSNSDDLDFYSILALRKKLKTGRKKEMNND
ncbi:MAG: winged helix-turn-helix transcriptional regulator [Clostridiaceae bacterium]|nr:winged helix-turn-helix transcriptional regulator [Clostridiaceae bacterium]